MMMLVAMAVAAAMVYAKGIVRAVKLFSQLCEMSSLFELLLCMRNGRFILQN